MPPTIVNPRIRLQPIRRSMAKAALELLRDQIPASDSKKYLSGRQFVPIFPTDDTALQAALLVVVTQLNSVVFPES